MKMNLIWINNYFKEANVSVYVIKTFMQSEIKKKKREYKKTILSSF